MDELAASDPSIQAYRQHWNGTLEAFFVKNLENVQGDECDIILISTVYGKTAEGVFIKILVLSIRPPAIADCTCSSLAPSEDLRCLLHLIPRKS
jgi:hypothetical protein